MLNQNVIDRLLIAKDFLDKIRFLPIANPDRYTTARNVLTSHDAAELAIAGIAHYLKLTPKSPQTYLMDYLTAISQKAHQGDEVPGKDFFSQLNTARNGIKHSGVFPDPKQWYRVGENTHSHISECCKKYLDISFDDLDESDMLSDPEVKKLYDIAREKFSTADYKGVFETLAIALYSLFDSNQALRNLKVGIPRAEDAIKLSAFGVHANEFFALQEFLPRIYHNRASDRDEVGWDQEKFGHPANWRLATADFSLKTFIRIALCIQDAEFIPGAIEFDSVYEHKVTALVDNVEIVQKRDLSLTSKEKEVERTLKKGESIRGKVTRKNSMSDLVDDLVALKLGDKPKKHKKLLEFMSAEPLVSGDIEADKVRVTCVPKDHDWIRKRIPGLTELEYE